MVDSPTEVERVYFAEVEVVPLPGSGMPQGTLGAFTYAFVAAHDADEAALRIAKALKGISLHLVELGSAEEYEGTEWDSDDQQAEHDACAVKAAASGTVVYSTFYSYKDD